jgi:D-threo-aldose 1-dehydrogenase
MEKLNQKSELGATGIFVPPIIFGTSALGNLYQVLDETTKLEIISAWFDWVEAPVVIDTAGKYGAGLALEVIGKGLNKLNIKPGDIIISNKLGWYRTELLTPEPTFEPGVWVDIKHDALQLISYDGIMACYEQGIALLGGKYHTQMLSVHDPDEYLAQASSTAEKQTRMMDILGGYRALKELKNQGKASAIGVGSKDWKVIRAITEKVDLDWVMLATSFTIMEHPAELLKFIDDLHRRNVSVINSAVFHGGFLTGSDYYNYQKLSPESYQTRPLYEWREKFYRICKSYDIQPSDACIHFGLSHPAIVGLALNTSRPAAIRANVELMQKKIPHQFWDDLKLAGLIDRLPFLG